MHVLIILVLLVLVFIIWSKQANKVPQQQTPQITQGEDRHAVAFISRGKLFQRKPGGDIVEIQSPYVQGIVDRMEKSRQLHGWKEGTSFGVSATGGMRDGSRANVEIQATSAQFLSNQDMLYFLADHSVGGLFSQNLVNGSENRLLHKQHLLLEDLSMNADGSKLLAASHANNGAANIAMFNPDGSDYREITAGDTVDTHPAWIPGQPNAVLYQSTGIARDEDGFAVAQGPASIQLLHTDSGALEVVREGDEWDFLQPKVGNDGCLYFIRRPYEMPSYGTPSLLLDSLLFPFRLLRAIFHYLNFFSLMYSRKPLSSASGPGVEADLKELLVQGKRFDAEQALRSGKRVGGVPSLVPVSWQLVRRTLHGEESVLARHVASFDFAPDGTLLFSNGFGVFSVAPNGAPRVIFKGKLIGDLIAGPGLEAQQAEPVQDVQEQKPAPIASSEALKSDD